MKSEEETYGRTEHSNGTLEDFYEEVRLRHKILQSAMDKFRPRRNTCAVF